MNDVAHEVLVESSGLVTSVDAVARREWDSRRAIERPTSRPPIGMYRFITFGGCAVVSDEGEVRGAATQQRRLALLAVLARAGDRGVSRTRLLQLFWPDEADEERRRKALAQALYALRRDLGDESVITGTQDLKLDGELLPHDVGLFAEHLKQGRHADAVALYTGPFLGGFHLAGAPAFERWAEEERRVLERDYLRALEALSEAAERAGRTGDAVQWRRKAAAVDPLDSRATLALMRALVAHGDVTTAIRQAAIHEALIQDELELPPDREVVAYARQLKEQQTAIAEKPEAIAQEQQTAIAALPKAIAPEAVEQERQHESEIEAVADVAVADAAVAGPTEAQRNAYASLPSQGWRASSFAISRRSLALLVVLMIAVVAAAFQVRDFLHHRRSGVAADSLRLFAVGRIMDFREQPATPAGALTDLLATSLARIDGLQVLSNARMLEINARLGGSESRDVSREAAHHAGATDLLEGGIQPLGNGRMLLDLRRVSVENGAIVGAWRFEGEDLFALVTSATTELARAVGRPSLAGDSSSMPTRSLVAYRFYEEGLRAFSRSDLASAEQLLSAAVKEDSLFAMAAFKLYQTRALRGVFQPNEVLARVVQLARGASDRDRLMITAYWAFTTARPELQALADTLAIRYPGEPDGAYYQAVARLQDGDSPAAIVSLKRVLALDSLSGSATPYCRACDAMESLVFAYQSLDSASAAERAAREWVGAQPESARAWTVLAAFLLHMDRVSEANEANQRATRLTGDGGTANVLFPVVVYLHAGQLDDAERALDDAARRGAATGSVMDLRIILRHLQGRLSDAERLAQEWLRPVPRAQRGDNVGRVVDWRRAVMWQQRGDGNRSMALWDSLSRFSAGDADPGQDARLNVQRWAVATSVAAAAQRADVAKRWADSSEAWSTRAPTRRDPRTAMWARGMALAAAGDTAGAIVTLQQAMYWPAFGLPRLNADLARLLLARGRYAEAIPVARGALRAPFDLRSSVADFTTSRMLLARAFEGAGQRDSALVHWRVVQRSWRGADAPLRVWADSAARRN
jgi:DNA-binding SARP family transcriptional activator